METILGWIGIVVGAAGAAVGALSGPKTETGAEPRPMLWPIVASALSVLVVYLSTIKMTPPFSVGQHLGYGALIGGAFGIVACILALRKPATLPSGGGFGAILAPCIALLGVSVTLMLFRSDPSPAFAGFLIGAIIPGLIFRITVPDSSAVDLWTVSALLLGATIMLGLFRYHTIEVRIWWRAPIILMVSSVISFLVGSVFYRAGRGYSMPALVSGVLTIGLSAVFAWKLFPDWHFLFVAVAGVVTVALCAWLARFGTNWSPASAGAALMVIALSAVSFKLMAGFGIGISLIAGTSVLLPAVTWSRRPEPEGEDVSPGSVSLYVMFIGIGMLLLRLFLERYEPDIRGFDIRPHYAMVAVAIGAILPFVLPAFFPVGGYRMVVRRAVGSALAGLFAAAVPLVLLVLWGMKPVLGFMVGTIAAEIFLLLAHMGVIDVRNREKLDLAALTTVAQLSAVLLAGVVSPLAEEPRMTKVWALAGVVIVGLIWSVISNLIDRRAAQEA